MDNRLRRWAARVIWRRLQERLPAEDSSLARHLFIDATIVRAHQQFVEDDGPASVSNPWPWEGAPTLRGGWGV